MGVLPSILILFTAMASSGTVMATTCINKGVPKRYDLVLELVCSCLKTIHAIYVYFISVCLGVYTRIISADKAPPVGCYMSLNEVTIKLEEYM